jgi:hypothetical protein
VKKVVEVVEVVEVNLILGLLKNVQIVENNLAVLVFFQNIQVSASLKIEK